MLMLDQRIATTIKTIANERSFSKAAAVLYISQPSLSRYVKTLESRTGIQLFDRSTLPLKLTAAGTILLKYIDKYEKLNHELQQELNQLSPSTVKPFKICCLPRLAIYLLPKILPYFARQFPMVDLQITEVERSDGIKALEEQKADIFLTNRAFKDPHFSSETLSPDSILLVANYSSALRKLYPTATLSPLDPVPINWNIFKNETMILLSPHQNMRSAAEKIFRHFHFKPHKIIEVASLPTALTLVCANKGITFICKSAMGGVSITSPLLYFSLGEIQHITDIRAIYSKANVNRYIPIFCKIAKMKLQDFGYR